MKFPYCSYVLFLVFGQIEANFGQFFNDTTSDLIDAALLCTKEIVQENFQIGSKLAIVRSGIVQNANTMKFFPDYVVEIINRDPNWSIVNRRAYEKGVKIIEVKFFLLF